MIINLEALADINPFEVSYIGAQAQATGGKFVVVSCFWGGGAEAGGPDNEEVVLATTDNFSEAEELAGAFRILVGLLKDYSGLVD